MLKVVSLVFPEGGTYVYICNAYWSLLKHLNVKDLYRTVNWFVSIMPIADVNYFTVDQSGIISYEY